MNQSFSLVSAAVLLTFAFASANAFARMGSGEAPLLSTGAGISSPSVISSIRENPAGLVRNTSALFLAEGLAFDDDFNPFGYGGGFFLGNGNAGLGLLLESSTDGGLSLGWGVGFEIPGLHMALGVSGNHDLSDSAPGGFGLDAGALFNANGPSRFGVTAYGLNDGVDALGAGFGLDINSSATFALDGAYGFTGESVVLKPGIQIHLQSVHFAVGYGTRVSGTTGSAGVDTGLSLGLGLPLARTVSLQGYYNQLSRYYFGLQISL